MASQSDSSATRQALRLLIQRLPKVLNDAAGVRRDVLAASLSQTHKVCGKPNCKCARGDKHVVNQLSWTDDGRRRSSHVRLDDLPEVQAAVRRYRRLRQCRAELLKIAAEGAAAIDALVEALRIPPPDKNRGRRK